ncbi:MAG: hypothetical protein BZY88_03025 [SAR202 cluster bacterium Io17-Chloro-G9]|nr:MAG: hypothetical protein BZY88_03025 [SAR202 cluster bacterium Io17-Chloro-G9]
MGHFTPLVAGVVGRKKFNYQTRCIKQIAPDLRIFEAVEGPGWPTDRTFRYAEVVGGASNRECAEDFLFK